MRKESFDFTGAGGDRLAGLLQLPETEPLAYALFAHCFTCGKVVRAAAQRHAIGGSLYDWRTTGPGLWPSLQAFRVR